MRRALLAGAVAALAFVGAHCALFYDLGTGGYTASNEGGPTTIDCGADATCPELVLGCASAKDCDAGMVCCVTIAGAASCSGSCGGATPGIQLCESNAECPEGNCMAQKCLLGSSMIGVNACGVQGLCTPL